jgi:hypothetical protein
MGHTCRSMGPHINADMRPFHSLVDGKGPQGPFPFLVASRSSSILWSGEQVCGTYPDSFDNGGLDKLKHEWQKSDIVKILDADGRRGAPISRPQAHSGVCVLRDFLTDETVHARCEYKQSLKLKQCRPVSLTRTNLLILTKAIRD